MYLTRAGMYHYVNCAFYKSYRQMINIDDIIIDMHQFIFMY